MSQLGEAIAPGDARMIHGQDRALADAGFRDAQ